MMTGITGLGSLTAHEGMSMAAAAADKPAPRSKPEDGARQRATSASPALGSPWLPCNRAFVP
jgi:hypothetical protein